MADVVFASYVYERLMRYLAYLYPPMDAVWGTPFIPMSWVLISCECERRKYIATNMLKVSELMLRLSTQVRRKLTWESLGGGKGERKGQKEVQMVRISCS
jgi:hypothetical protein